MTRLDDLKDEKITKGKIIAYITNFQELDTINSLMSTILSDNDFFKKVSKQSITFTYAGWNENITFNLKYVYKIFELRHEIIHEMSDFEGTLTELRRYFANVMIFLNASHVIIQNIMK